MKQQEIRALAQDMDDMAARIAALIDGPPPPGKWTLTAPLMGLVHSAHRLAAQAHQCEHWALNNALRTSRNLPASGSVSYAPGDV